MDHASWIIRATFFEIAVCYLPAGRSVLGKTVPEVLSTARGRSPRAVLKTEGTVGHDENEGSDSEADDSGWEDDEDAGMYD